MTAAPAHGPDATPIERANLHLTIDGERVDVGVPVDRLLIDLLRDDLGRTGTKLGCGIGVCGLCAVIVDGDLKTACLLPAVLVDGATIETVEGLADADGSLSALQASFIREGGFQCGICTPGQLMTATALLREEPDPDDATIDTWMLGSLCRCTGYVGIRAAIHAAAASGPGAGDGS